jgi:transcriptional regulator with XRE-family HTH domain
MTHPLKQFRKRNNLTQIELAKILKIDQGIVSKIETDVMYFSFRHLVTLAKKYDNIAGLTIALLTHYRGL